MLEMPREVFEHGRKITRSAINCVRSFPVWFRPVNEGYDKVVWLLGAGRSGTTWVASLLNYWLCYRQLFEPFHPRLAPYMEGLAPHLYVRPRVHNEGLQRIAEKIFTGRIIHPRVDIDQESSEPLFRGLLIKDIFANLFAKWAMRQFPGVQLILLIRNPFAVALSKLKKRSWFWVTDPRQFLEQRALHVDYLEPFTELIIKTASEDDFIVNQVLIWAILYYIPLQQFNSGEVSIIFYEDVFREPDRQIAQLVERCKPSAVNKGLPTDLVESPSRVSGPETTLRGTSSPLTAWKDTLTPRQIDDGLEILVEFGLARVYGTGALPSGRASE